MSSKKRAPREIPWIAGGPDPKLVRSNNAHYIIELPDD
jgi:hypothetical protein